MFTSPNEKPGAHRNAIDGLQPASPKALLQRLHDGDCELFHELTQGFLPKMSTPWSARWSMTRQLPMTSVNKRF